jgi:UDP-3-O-[3-hydroxymyristoyl] glucosamine N-acyltransferase
MSVELTLAEVARLTGGEVVGDARLTVDGLAGLEHARAGQLSFVTGPRHAEAALRSLASAFLVPAGVDLPGRALVRVAQPTLAMATVLAVFHPDTPAPVGVHPTAQVDPTATVAPDATVMAFAVVGAGSVVEAGAVLHPHVYVGPGCRVGAASVLHAHVVLQRDVELGRRVVIHAGTVLGADGFGYAFDGARHRKIPQVGRVVIRDDVEIGANTAVDRATLGETVIEAGTKIDNLVQIGHNTAVGAHAVIVAQAGIAGSCRLGSHVVLAGQAGIADHVTLGDGVQVGAQAGVAYDIERGAQVLGSPAVPVGQARRLFAAQARLPELLRTVRQLEKRVAELERRLGAGAPPA